MGVYIPSDDGGASTAEETCCEDLPGGEIFTMLQTNFALPAKIMVYTLQISGTIMQYHR